MKLELSKNTITVKPYEYRDRQDLTEVIVPDAVETIGEGAFKDCRNLNKLTIGKSVKTVGIYAFDGIGKRLDVIWLSRALYRSPFVKILPSFDEIECICAPQRAFEKAGKKEQFLLACGYLFHPEYESSYSEEQKEQYRSYINHEFSGHFNELCEKGLILDLFLRCRQRNLLETKELTKQFLSYIRTRRMTKEEKNLIDQIELEEGLTEAEEDVTDKKLCRFIREQMTEEKMRETLEREGLQELPAVTYKDSGHKAPAEALKYILTAYASQWTYMDFVPRDFHVDEQADQVAARLDQKELRCVLQSIATQNDEQYPRRMIPFLRYADDLQVEQYIEKSEHWKQYDRYGQDGILAKETFSKAILLNDTETALLYAYRNQMLPQYGFLRKKKVEVLFLQTIDILEKRGLTEELHELCAQYIHKLHVEYLSGKKTQRKDWEQFYMTHPVLKTMTETLVWETEEKNGPLFLMTKEGAVDQNDHSVVIKTDCRIGLAHPVFMSTDQVRGFQRILKKRGLKPCFPQLKIMKTKLDLGDWQLWNRRYYKLNLPYEKLQALVSRGFSLDGRLSERLRISYYGKVLMEAFAVSFEKEDNPMMELGYILGSNYNMREINESVSLLDDAFCYEMILAGRMEAASYIDRFSLSEVKELLAASIACGHRENTAVLLEQKEKLASGGTGDDLSLDW